MANHDIDITVSRGTVHALVGENGAGKSTLMKILYGMQKPDEGTISVDGEQVSFSSPGDAIDRGIGMVHQHFMLADYLTVLENVVLGSEKLHGIGDRARAKIKEISDAYGLGIRPDAVVEDLGVADRQRVEILKVLYRGARTLILDEPTAVLVPQEVDALFDNLRELKAEGLTVIFISHKLGEVLSVADEITVIRRGTTVGTADPATTTSKQLAELMVGSELPSPETRESTVTDTPMLAVEDLRLTATDPDGVVRAVLDGITFTIHKGEVLGIAGVEGNGQSELVDAIMGMRTLDKGSLTLDGADISRTATRKRREDGMAVIPEDRHRHGLLLDAPLWENRMLGHVTERPNSKGAFLDLKAARADTERIVREYDVRTPGIGVTAASLSGGNQQKLIVGREMSHNPKLLIAAHPTRGVDVGAQAQIWDQIREARHEGLAVLLISADLDELIGLSDTLRVMYRGQLVADADPATVTPEELGSAMTGAAAGHLEAPGATAAGDTAADGSETDPGTGRGPMKKFDKERLLLGIAAPLLAIVVAFLVTALVLAATGKEPFSAFGIMFDYGLKSDSQVYILNKGTTYYLAGLAVAVGFRMNLFNIGVDGQYRLAAFFAAALGGALTLPGALQIPLIILTAMIVGAMWAGIAGLLKVTRGVSEVVSTIMLNSIATAIIGYLLQQGRLGHLDKAGTKVSTTPIPESSHFFEFPTTPTPVWGFIVIAVVAGVAYWFTLSRTRFGFDLRTVGQSGSAAEASGVDVRKMVVTSMLISGGMAGLIGMPTLLNDSYEYSGDFPVGIGFTGIAIALLGRNHPVGIALGALLWGFLERGTGKLEFEGYDKEIVGVIQGVIVLCVVIAYEVVRRYGLKRQQSKVGAELAAKAARNSDQQEVSA